MRVRLGNVVRYLSAKLLRTTMYRPGANRRKEHTNAKVRSENRSDPRACFITGDKPGKSHGTIAIQRLPSCNTLRGDKHADGKGAGYEAGSIPVVLSESKPRISVSRLLFCSVTASNTAATERVRELKTGDRER